ncbi:hypothetical protein ACKI2C_48345, partial [Streptomyces brasiliscabiei]
TANALKGEKERCLNAGINDFITKPVELNTLEAILEKWAQKSQQGTVYVSELGERPAAPVNLEMLAKYVNNDEAKQIRFFKMYLEQSNNLTKEINSAVMVTDYQGIAQA